MYLYKYRIGDLRLSNWAYAELKCNAGLALLRQDIKKVNPHPVYFSQGIE